MRRTGLYGRFYGSGGSRLRPELKWHDATTGDLKIDTPSQTTIFPSIVLVNAGNGGNAMVGQKILIKKLQIRAKMERSWDANNGPGGVCNALTYRMVLVQDKQANGSGVIWTDVFSNGNINSMPKIENSKRFRILKEWRADLNGTITVDTSIVPYVCGAQRKTLWWNKKCNINIEYSNQAGVARDINEIRSNNLTVLLALEGNINETEMLNMEMRARIRYLDY